MKKFTLILATALFSLFAVAQNTLHRSEFTKLAKSHSKVAPVEQKNIQQHLMMSPQQVKEAKLNVQKAIMAKPKLDVKSRIPMYAGAETEPTYMTTKYNCQALLEDWGDFAWIYWNSGEMAFTDNAIAVMGNFSLVFEGKIESGSNSLQDAYNKSGHDVKIDSVTLSIDVEGNSWEGKDGKKYEAKIVKSSYDETNGWIVEPTGETTVGGYFFRQTNELLVPVEYALFADGNLLANTTCYGIISTPTDSLNACTYKAEVTHSMEFEDGPYTLKCDTAKVTIYGTDIYMSGLAIANRDAVLCATLKGDNDGYITGATMEYNQYIGSGNLTLKDGSKPYCDLVFFPITVSDNLTKYLNFFVDETNDGGLMLSSDGNSLYAELFGSQEFDGVGLYAADKGADGTIITIKPELVNAVKGVAAANNPTSVEYFDMQGRKVSSSAKGLVIKRVRNADGVVTSTKMIK